MFSSNLSHVLEKSQDLVSRKTLALSEAPFHLPPWQPTCFNPGLGSHPSNWVCFFFFSPLIFFFILTIGIRKVIYISWNNSNKRKMSKIKQVVCLPNSSFTPWCHHREQSGLFSYCVLHLNTHKLAYRVWLDVPSLFVIRMGLYWPFFVRKEMLQAYLTVNS